MMTFPSYEHDARIVPYFGWAHETDHTEDVWPERVVRRVGVLVDGSTSEIVMWEFERAVASLRPK